MRYLRSCEEDPQNYTKPWRIGLWLLLADVSELVSRLDAYKQSALDNIQKTTLNEIDTVLRLSRLKVHPHLNLPRYIAHLKQKFLGPMEAEAERSC
jgi:hypothetical protein